MADCVHPNTPPPNRVSVIPFLIEGIYLRDDDTVGGVSLWFARQHAGRKKKGTRATIEISAARVHFFCGPRAAERVITSPRRPCDDWPTWDCFEDFRVCDANTFIEEELSNRKWFPFHAEWARQDQNERLCFSLHGGTAMGKRALGAVPAFRQRLMHKRQSGSTTRKWCGFPVSQSGKPLKVSVHHNTQAVRSLVKSAPHTNVKINPHVHESITCSSSIAGAAFIGELGFWNPAWSRTQTIIAACVF